MKNTRLLALLGLLLWGCAEPLPPSPPGPNIPSIDDLTTMSLVTWNIERMDDEFSNTTRTRVRQILDSLDADIYCLQEIERSSELQAIVDELPRYTAIISEDTGWDNLAIIYKHDVVGLLHYESLFVYDDYNFAGRPPQLGTFGFNMQGKDHLLNVINLHMKCCERSPSDVERRHNASEMLHTYVTNAMAYNDSNFIMAGDWNDDMHDPDGSGLYAMEAFLEDPDNFLYVTDSLSETGSVQNASFPGWPSFLDHIMISRSLFDEFSQSRTEVLRLDEVFSDYSTHVSDHRPVLWSFTPN